MTEPTLPEPHDFIITAGYLIVRDRATAEAKWAAIGRQGALIERYTADQLRAYADARVAQERERCAALVEQMTKHKRFVRAGINSEPMKPCEYAAAIRKEPTP